MDVTSPRVFYIENHVDQDHAGDSEGEHVSPLPSLPPA
jgi:hypothetical protein